MKKFIALLLLVFMTFFVTACTETTKVGDLGTEQAEEMKIEENSTETTKWKEFIDDYSEWVDKYIVLAKKFKDNPTDFSIISDYTNMASEVIEWSTRAEEIQEELSKASPDEVAKYSAELLKIAEKLAKVSY